MKQVISGIFSFHLRRIKNFFLGISVLAFSIVHSNALAQSNTEIKTQTNVFIKAKEYEQAIQYLNKIIVQQPKNDVAYAQRARLYSINLSTSEAALKDANTALTLNNRNTDALNIRGVIASRNNQLDQALADFNQAIAVDPMFAKPYSNRAEVYLKKNEADKALPDCNRALALDSNAPVALIYRAYIYIQTNKEINTALADLNKAETLSPEEPLIYALRGRLYQYKLKPENLDQALADYTKALTLNPKQPDVYTNRGLIYALKEQYEPAIADYTKALEANPTSFSDRNMRGYMYLAQNKHAQAMADFKSVPKESTAYESATRGIELIRKIDNGAYATYQNAGSGNKTESYDEWWEKTYGKGGSQNRSAMPNNNIPQSSYQTGRQSEADRHQQSMDKIYRETEKQMNRGFGR